MDWTALLDAEGENPRSRQKDRGMREDKETGQVIWKGLEHFG